MSLNLIINYFSLTITIHTCFDGNSCNLLFIYFIYFNSKFFLVLFKRLKLIGVCRTPMWSISSFTRNRQFASSESHWIAINIDVTSWRQIKTGTWIPCPAFTDLTILFSSPGGRLNCSASLVRNNFTITAAHYDPAWVHISIFPWHEGFPIQTALLIWKVAEISITSIRGKKTPEILREQNFPIWP